MAVCEIWDVRGRLDHPIDYAENPEKTANPKSVSYTHLDVYKRQTRMCVTSLLLWWTAGFTSERMTVCNLLLCR